MLLILEFCFTAIAIPLAFIAPRLCNRWFSPIESRLSRFAARRKLTVLTILILALGARLAVLPIEPIPVPGIHDEFGYLLLGDTFANGQLTNSTHPMWVHFESITIIQQPTYCSAFYPAQGFFLAAGQIFFRHPFWGVWLSTGLMCAAICWALQGWLPPAWALLGGILAIMRVGTFSYWVHSYWGGAVAAIGGAMIFGALPRVKRRARVRDALIMGIGLAILANSRPYEGLFNSFPILTMLGIFILSRKAPPWRISLRRIVIPLVIVLVLTFGWMGYYFWRTTGSPVRPAYFVNNATYMAEPPFLWQSMKTFPTYHHRILKEFYLGYHVELFLDAKRRPLTSILGKMFKFWTFFVGPALTLPFLFLGGVFPYGTSLRDFGRKTQFILTVSLISFLGMLLPFAFQPHYAAPMMCAAYALVLQAMRRVRMWDRHGRLKGLFVVRAVIVLCSTSFLLTTSGLAFGVSRHWLLAFEPNRSNVARSQLAQSLSEQPGKHLVIVQYETNHDLRDEWVYNAADIDNAKVVWARQMTPAEDEALITHFKDRHVWLLDADQKPPKFVVYPAVQIPRSGRSPNELVR